MAYLEEGIKMSDGIVKIKVSDDSKPKRWTHDKFNWVKRLGQGHISGPGSTTLCGMAKLGNNYAGHIRVTMPCQECIDAVPTVTEHFNREKGV